VNNGKRWPGYKLVEGKSNRKYSDEQAIAKRLNEFGYADDIIFEKKLLGITNLQKAIGKNTFEIHVTEFLVKPPGKLALVPASDKRPEYSSTESAVNDFSNA
jgi:hypothetical protein